MLDQVKRDDLRKATLSRNIADDNVFTHAVLSSMSGAFVEFLVTERQAYFRRMCYTSTMTVGQRVRLAEDDRTVLLIQARSKAAIWQV